MSRDARDNQHVAGESKSQTALAKRCAPPADPSALVWMIATFPSLFLALYPGFGIGAATHSFWVGLISYGVAVAAMTIAMYQLWLNLLGGHASMARYRAALAEWRQSWMCLQCGSVAVKP